MHENIENCVSFQTFCIHRHDYVCFSKSSRFSTSSNNRLFECCCEDVGYKTYCITFFSKMNKVLTTELLLILLLSFFFSSHFLSSFFILPSNDKLRIFQRRALSSYKTCIHYAYCTKTPFRALKTVYNVVFSLSLFWRTTWKVFSNRRMSRAH